MRLQRAKEVQKVLLLRRTQRTKPFDYLFRLRRHAAAQQTAEETAVRGVCANCVQQVGGATVVKEKQTLPQSPERCRAELLATGCALRDSIGQVRTHVMHSQVGEEICRLVAQSYR